MNDYYFYNDSSVISFNSCYYVSFKHNRKKNNFTFKFYYNSSENEFDTDNFKNEDEFMELLDKYEVDYIYMKEKNGDGLIIPATRFMAYSGGSLYISAMNGDIKTFETKIIEYRTPNQIKKKQREEAKKEASSQNERRISYNYPDSTEKTEKKEEKAPERRISAPIVKLDF